MVTIAYANVDEFVLVLYQPFPSTSPEFAPRDEVADWLEQYVTTQNLVVWTNSELQAHPRYDAHTGRWEVIVARAGVAVRLHPSHIVVATGLLGRPFMPTFAGSERFQGQYTHSANFPGGSSFVGMRVVVVGAANSAIDVCQDLALAGAASITMIQRSATCVQDLAFLCNFFKQLWPEDELLEVSDLKVVALPLHFLERRTVATRDFIVEAHREMFDDLQRCGLKLQDPGCNPYLMALSSRGGTWEIVSGFLLPASFGLSLNQLLPHSNDRFL